MTQAADKIATAVARSTVAPEGADAGPRTRPRKRFGSTNRPQLLLPFSDLIALVAAFIVAAEMNLALRPIALAAKFEIWYAEFYDSILALYGGMSVAILFSFWILQHYSHRKPYWDEINEVIKWITFVSVSAAVLVVAFKVGYSRTFIATHWAFAIIFVLALRHLVKRALLAFGLWQRPTFVIGIGRNARDTSMALTEDPLFGYELRGFIALPGSSATETSIDLGRWQVPIQKLGDDWIAEISRTAETAEIVLALDHDQHELQDALVNALGPHNARLHIVPSLRGLPTLGTDTAHFFGHDVFFLRIRNNLARPSSQVVKRTADIVGAGILLTLLAVPMAVIALLARRDSGTPFYGQQRVGRHGRRFICWKFSSMVANGDRLLEELLSRDQDLREEWKQSYKLKADPRTTPVGRFLRKTSLDELPQLWNVLKGEMSLVGPRPIIVDEMRYYGEEIAYYLQTRPGLTGVWQVSGRTDTDYRRRIALDVWYVKNWSLWYDFVILCRTVRVVLSARGAY